MKPLIFQIFYKESQRKFLDYGFTPYNNCMNLKPLWCEYWIFKCFHTLNSFLKPTGFVSWKFYEKTGLRSEDFYGFVEENPNYDVWFINPFADEAALYYNIWEHGETKHEGITKIAQYVFNQVGYFVDLKQLTMPYEKTAFCNYFVGTPEFWEKYMAFCDPIYQYIDTNKIGPLFVSNQDYRPYIFERLFSTFLCMHPEIKSKRYEFSVGKMRERYGNFYSTIVNLSHLKNTNIDAFRKQAKVAREDRDYGSNIKGIRKIVHDTLRLSFIKNPTFRLYGRKIKQAIGLR